MAEHRNEPRSQGYAKVFIEEKPGYLRNLTEDGCKIVTFMALPTRVGESPTFLIIPDETAGIKRITLEAELRWGKPDGDYFVYGFHILSFASDEDRDNYLSLVSLHGRS